MSLHPPKKPETVDDVVKAAPSPAPRDSYVWNGIKIQRRFARRPRVFRVEASRARGCGVGENPITFPEVP